MTKEPYPSASADRYIVRFPDGMRDRLKALATENGRSLNAEIIHRLQTTLEMDEYAEPTVKGYEDTDSDRLNRLLERIEEMLTREKK